MTEATDNGETRRWRSSGIRVAVIGASGGIGHALAGALEARADVGTVFRLGRGFPTDSDGASRLIHLDLEDDESIARAATAVQQQVDELDLVLVASGILQHADSGSPEKSWRALSSDGMAALFRVNTIGPAMIGRYFLPMLSRAHRSAFAVLSARVGSIADNHLGGWHSYRASKAALNMVVKTLSVELARRNPGAICVSLHPGTVDTPLSAPFSRNIAADKLFTPERAARHLLQVIEGLGPEDSGGFLAWDGTPIPF